MGAKAYKIIEDVNTMKPAGENLDDKFLKNFKPLDGDIVEIGSERGDGSTKFLNNFAKENSMNFYTVDFAEEPYLTAKFVYKMNENAFQMKGEDFLKDVYPKLDSAEGKICFAYLDNFDYAFPELVKHGKDFLDEQKGVYDLHGIEYNNENSKLAHLEQSKLVHKYAAEKCFILFDDTYYEPDGSVGGKGGTAIPWLLENGWYLVPVPNSQLKRHYWEYEEYEEWKQSQPYCWFLLINVALEVDTNG